MSEPLISVIVPIYKVEEYLDTCIKSILNQTYKNLEIILVDDGSPDRCPQMCDEYAKMDSRIVVIHKENSGVADSRNIGIKKSCGEYITFIDSDDAVNCHMLEDFMSAILQTGADISCCGQKKFECDDEINLSEAKEYNLTVADGKSIFRDLFFNKIKSFSYQEAWSRLFKRTFFIEQDMQFPVGRLYEDSYIIYKILYAANKIALIDCEYYMYRQRAGSIMHSNYTIKHCVDNIESFGSQLMFFYDKNEQQCFNLAFKLYCRDAFDIYRVCREQAIKDGKRFILKEYRRVWKQYARYAKASMSNLKYLYYSMFKTFPNCMSTIHSTYTAFKCKIKGSKRQTT